jgi:hypothetical protein
MESDQPRPLATISPALIVNATEISVLSRPAIIRPRHGRARSNSVQGSPTVHCASPSDAAAFEVRGVRGMLGRIERQQSEPGCESSFPVSGIAGDDPGTPRSVMRGESATHLLS